MEGEMRFTWFPKLTHTAEKVPEQMRGQLLWAMIRYGTYGEEPDLPWPLDAIFESVREDIYNSKNAIVNGKKGGSSKKKGRKVASEPPLQESETHLGESANPPSNECAMGVAESAKGGSGEAEPKPYQTIPNHTKPNGREHKARFTAPTPDEVAAYAEERGTPIDANRFCDFYAAKGWMVGSNRMKDWRAAVRNWAARDRSERKVTESADDEYSRL